MTSLAVWNSEVFPSESPLHLSHFAFINRCMSSWLSFCLPFVPPPYNWSSRNIGSLPALPTPPPQDSEQSSACCTFPTSLIKGKNKFLLWEEPWLTRAEKWNPKHQIVFIHIYLFSNKSQTKQYSAWRIEEFYFTEWIKFPRGVGYIGLQFSGLVWSWVRMKSREYTRFGSMPISWHNIKCCYQSHPDGSVDCITD